MPTSTNHVCDPAEVDWDYGNARYDEHQHVIPGTCQKCGQHLEYTYNEAGIRKPDGEYLHEF